MKLRSRRGAILLVLVLFGVVAIFLLTRPAGAETCFDRLGGPGPNSNTPRLDTYLDIPTDRWPAFAGMLSGFGAERGWLVDQGVGDRDPAFRWLDMCDTVTIVRADNQYMGSDRIGFGIIHMTYEGPARDGWQAPYRDLHRRLEARWPGRLRYVEGEFGQPIARPGWLDAPSPSGAAPGDQPGGNAAR